MYNITDINEYIQSLKKAPRMADQVVYHTLIPGKIPVFGKPEKPWPEIIESIIKASGISKLYSHQAQAIDRIRSGTHVMVATPTASGKTMIYNLPVLENIINNPGSKALYLFPLKALAQDQHRNFQKLVSYNNKLDAGSAIYDGDTSAWFRKKIRENLPNVVITNPDMIHLSFLPYHQIWADFFSNLDIIVVDEVHTYRGVMGSHMAQVFRRLVRICNLYGSSPTFVFCSATIGNPGELAKDLTGLEVEVISESGASQGKKHLIFMDSVQGPAQTAILLLKAALHRRLRTIVYSQSRKMTELIAIWAGSRSGRFSHFISSYRAGFLPEERREIESRLSQGDLLAVISTSALELGINIGDLDLCLLVGYPGTIVATWQRGGRVGRSGQDSALILIAGEDALDQYFMRHPLELLSREPESAVVNPYNPEILKKHLVCAAAEFPLQKGEAFIEHKNASQAISFLEKKALLLRSGDGNELFAARKAPHRDVDLRGTGTRFYIICESTGKNMGDIDGFRAFRETHPGAIYLHNGEKFLYKSQELPDMDCYPCFFLCIHQKPIQHQLLLPLLLFEPNILL
ncbi:DEAD/DEAH box helicase [Desulfobacterales bacterium HSG17]|nr:DEAD/DEAH box helicase [Desulfobacterales bacterium HSG17]